MSSFSYGGMSYEQLKYLLDHNGVPGYAKVPAMAYLKRLEAEKNSKPAMASSASSPAPTTSPVNIDMNKIRARLKGVEDQYVAQQGANIDRDASRNLSQGMSNMIGSGLAGSTVVGGMQAGVQEVATRAKGDVASQAANRTEGLMAQYTNMAQAAQEAAANRRFQAEQNAANRAAQMSLARMSSANANIPLIMQQQRLNATSERDRNRRRDTIGFGFADSRSRPGSKYRNMGMVGSRAPRLF